jgi:hypothetical protein
MNEWDRKTAFSHPQHPDRHVIGRACVMAIIETSGKFFLYGGCFFNIFILDIMDRSRTID